MARADGAVIIETLMNTQGFDNGMANMKKGFNGMSAALGKIAKLMAGVFAAKSLVSFGKEAIELGSDLEEVQNVVDVTFGELNEEVNEFAKNAIEQFGLSETAAKQYASTMGAMLKSMGFTTRQAADMGMELTGLAGDIASFYNLDADEAFAKIRSGISGETEPLKQLGINLNVANLEHYALTKGITKSYNAMTQQEQALLRYNYLLSVTTDAQGDFARTSDSWANQTRILSERFKALKATLGQGLINIFTPLIKIMNMLLAKIQTVANAFKAFTELITGKKSSGSTGSGLVGGTALDLGDSDYGLASENVGELGDTYNDASEKAKKLSNATDNVADATKNAADAAADAKKENDKYLSGLDEIRRFETKDFDIEDIGDIGDVGKGSIVDPGESIGDAIGDLAAAAEDVDFGNLAEGETILDKTNSAIDKIIGKFKELKDIFMQGFWDGLGDWQYRWESIKDSIASIKDSLIDIFTDPAVLAAADRWAQSVAYMFGSLVGSLASIGLTIGANLLGGIAKYLEQNKDRIKQYLISMFDIWAEVNYLFADLFQSIAYVFEAFASEQGQQLTANIIGIFMDAFMGITELASKLFRDIATIIIKPFVDNKEAFRTALEGFLGVLAEVTGTIKQGIDDTFDKLNEVYDTHFKPFFDSVAQGLSDLVAKFLEFWNGNVQPILNQMAADFDALWQSHIQPLLNNAAEFLGKIIDLIKALWENVLQPFIAWFIQNILPTILPAIQAIWNMVVNFVGYISDAISSIITILGGIIDFLTGVFTGDWKLAFQGLESIVSGFVDLITGIIEAFFAMIRDLLNTFIAAIKSAVSAFGQALFDLANKVLDTIKSNIVDKFTEITQRFQDFINNAKEKWNSGWDALKEKVKSIIEEIKNAIQAAFDWIAEKVDAIAEKLSSVGDKAKSIFSKGTSFVSSIFKKSKFSVISSMPSMPSIPVIESPQIPYLASGAVIPPNAPFAAILGDQKNGKNLELPENLLRKIVREESGNNQGFNGTIRIPLTIGGRQILEAVITAAQLQQMMDGKNPFEMA